MAAWYVNCEDLRRVWMIMSTSAETDVVLDIDSLKTFTIPKRRKSKTGTVVDLNKFCCQIVTTSTPLQ